MIAVDADYSGQTGFVGAPISGAYVRQPIADQDYIRRVTFNVGLVFNPRTHGGLLDDFTVSLDYYSISIKNVISAVPGLTVLSKCFNLDGSNPTYSNSNQYCQLMQRDPTTGQILTVATPYLNLGGLKTNGFESQIHWGVDTPFLGASAKLYVDTAVNYLEAYKVQLLPGAPFLDYTGISVGGAGPAWFTEEPTSSAVDRSVHVEASDRSTLSAEGGAE